VQEWERERELPQDLSSSIGRKCVMPLFNLFEPVYETRARPLLGDPAHFFPQIIKRSQEQEGPLGIKRSYELNRFLSIKMIRRVLQVKCI